jgi:DNA polymerase III epsilon subunit-like protein
MESQPKRYISVDVETSGQFPWNSSMLSLGACVVDGKFDKTFYAELKPINRDYLIENFKIGASSLNCLKDYNFNNFDAEEILKILLKKGKEPKKAILEFTNWVLENTSGYKPVLAAAPIIFDGMFVSYYMNKFYLGENPFGFSGEDINSIFRGSVRDIKANIKELSIREKGRLRHNALEDAVQQAKEFYTTLVHMRQHKV